MNAPVPDAGPGPGKTIVKNPVPSRRWGQIDSDTEARNYNTKAMMVVTLLREELTVQRKG